MAKNNYNTIIQVVHPICCGMDIHKEIISACLIKTNENGQEEIEIKEFGTFTDELIKMREWLLLNDCEIVAMESTGIYWRPIHNILEGYMEVLIVNARSIKNVPGRKTDIEDSKWIGGLLRHGLVRGSFIPPEEVREWRDLSRLRRKYTETLGDFKRRTQKLFETANIKIDSVVSDLFGTTGRNLMKLLECGRKEISIDDIKSCVRGKLKVKVDELYRSIQGFFKEHHRYILKTLLATINMLEGQIKEITNRNKEMMSSQEDLLERLKTIPGVSDISAQAILSELGTNLDEFQSGKSLACWSGLSPGNNESAGKKRSGKSPVKNKPIKTILVEVAWAAVRQNGSYYKDKYYRLKSRRGAKKAIIAIAHRILLAIYNIIKFGTKFQDLGENYLTLRNKQAKTYYLKKQAKLLGFQLISENT